MTKRFVKVSLAILALAALAWASDPWKSKPYQQWDQKDINQVLNRSPWVQTVHVALGSQMNLNSQTMGGQPMGVPNNQGTASGRPGMGGSQSGGGGEPGMGGGPVQAEPTTFFEARWMSSLTMRQAVARLSELQGKVSQAAVEHYLAQAPADYQIDVVGPDMAIFLHEQEADLVKHSFLEAKHSKKKVAPDKVTIQREPGSQIVTAVEFDFPRTVDGQPLIGPKENQIEFVCKTKQRNLQFHFNPHKMVTKQGPDL
jgi:hypothetical protein